MTKKIRILTWGGIGDVLLTTPVVKELKENNKDAEIIVYCTSKSHREVYVNNPHVDKVRNFFFKSLPVYGLYFKWKKITPYVFSYAFHLPSILYKQRVTELIAEMADVKLKNHKLQVFLKSEEVKKAKEQLSAFKIPVIIHITSLTSKNQEWPIEKWNELVRRNPELSFIQLGLDKEPLVEGVVDFRGKTSFREALGLISQASSFVGVVSSFSHATNAFDTPGVVLFGPSSPEIWGHDNNVNLYKSLSCAPCIDLLFNGRCPYNQPCLRDITVDEVESALLMQIKTRIADENNA